MLLRGKPVISLDAICGRRADSGLGGGDRNGMGMSELHVEPHLMIVDVAARHERHPLPRSYAFEYLTGRNHQKRPGKGEKTEREWCRERGCQSGEILVVAVALKKKENNKTK